MGTNTRRTGSTRPPAAEPRRVAAARRHAARVEFALVQLAVRLDEAASSADAERRVRLCETIVNAAVARAIAALRSEQAGKAPRLVAASGEEARAA